MRFRRSVWCVALFLGVTAGSEGAVSSRRAGFVLLREGIGARAAAMGEAYTAMVGDQTAAFWNPAGVGAMQGKDFLLVHNRSMQGIQQAYGGWAYGNQKRGVGLSLGVYSVGGLETRTGPSVEPLGTFSIYDLNAGWSYAQRIGKRLYAGGSLRALHENIGPESAWGFAVDLGVLYRAKGLALGAAYRNVGRTERLDRERIRLPRTFRVGAVYAQGPVVGSVDFRMPEQGARGVHLGLEYAVKQILFLRGGYRSGHETRDISFGFGLVKRNWRVSYAFVPSDLGLGGSHRMAVGIR